MSNSLFVNQTDTGSYTVRPAHTDTPLHTAATQDAAIKWAEGNYPNNPLHVARVRTLSDKKNPAHWRKI